MPISRDDFERGRTPDSWEDRFTEFLNGQPGRAFAAEELAEAVGFPLPEKPDPKRAAGTADERIARTLEKWARSNSLISLGYYLDSLVKDGKIEGRTVETADGRRQYYAARP